MLYISASNDAVDAVLTTKKIAVDDVARAWELKPHEMAVIGDGINDLPMLQIEGLGLVGAPANAQKEVKEFVKGRNGYISKRANLDGFIDFYELAIKRGIRHVISDRDGVIITFDSRDRGEEFSGIAKGMGMGKPMITIVTGSGYEQNIGFMADYGLNKTLESNPVVRKNPFVLLVENGAVAVNVLTGKPKVIFDGNTAVLEAFRSLVLKRAEKLLPAFGFEFSRDYGDQKGKAYIVPKITGVTINIPHSRDGSVFRGTSDSEAFASAVMDVMSSAAIELGIKHQRL
jgi:hypothetical protein